MNLPPSCRLTLAALTVLLVVPALAQSQMAAPMRVPAGTAPAPPYVSPKGTGLIIGRVIYKGGQPAGGVGVVAAIQTSSDPAEAYIAGHETTLKDTNGKPIGFSFWGPLPESVVGVEFVSAVTRADGTYRIHGVTTASYNVMVMAPHQSLWDQADAPSDWVTAAAQGVQSQESQTVHAPTLVLTRGAIIRGHVVEASTGRPLPGIIVKAHGPERPASSAPTLTTVTDGAGCYALRVAAGRSELAIDGVRLATGEEHDWSMRFDSALWELDDHLAVRVDRGRPETKNSRSDFVSLETAAGQSHAVVFELGRGKLQHRLLR
jgi:hypothetical protein